MYKLLKNQTGLAVVEATILLPFCMLMVISIYYASIFMCQKANLQANLQTALLYYKNVESDRYVEAKTNMSYSVYSGTIGAVGGSYSGASEFLFPYRFFGMAFKNRDFETFFHSICGHMFFDDGSNVILTSKSYNYVVYKTIEATATQTVKPAISFSALGIPDEMIISVTGKAVVNDADDLVNNIDFIVDILGNTEIGKKASELADKAVEIYGKFKEKFDI